MAGRIEQAERALAKQTVVYRYAAGRKRRVRVDPGVASKLARFSDRVSIRVLTWAARQAMLLHQNPEPDPSGSGKTLGQAFVLGFGEVIDWSEASLRLAGNKATRINLLQYDGKAAWLAQLQYHQLLHQVSAEGEITIPKGWTAFQLGAVLGVSPGMLRQVNHGSVGSFPPGRQIFVAKPNPLEHRLSLVDYDGGISWVWIKPGIDKDRVGRNIGLCISQKNVWNDRLQFALVDDENRPHAVLTMKVGRPGPQGPGQMLFPDPNSLIEVDADRDGKIGRVRLDIAKILRQQLLVMWSECKGRFNKRPIPDPYRRYGVALLTSGLLGPVQVQGDDAIAAADLTALLTEGLKPKVAGRLWKKAGGEPSIFNLADALRPTTMGDGGAGEQTLSYFDAAPMSTWLKSAMAPLVIAASTNDELAVIWRNFDDRLLRAEIARAVQRRDLVDKVFWETELTRAQRIGVAVPPETVRALREKLKRAESFSRGVSATALKRLVRKIALGEGLPGDYNSFDVYVALLDRGSPRVLDTRFVTRLFKYISDESVLSALAITIDRFVELQEAGWSIPTFNATRTERTRDNNKRFKRRDKPYHLDPNVPLSARFVGLASTVAASASMEIAHRGLTPKETAELAEMYPGWSEQDYPHNIVSHIMGGEPWHCANCMGMDDDSAGIAASIYPDWAWSWEAMFPAPPNYQLIGSLLGHDSPLYDDAMSSIHDVVSELVDPEVSAKDALHDLVIEWGYMVPLILAELSTYAQGPPGSEYRRMWERAQSALSPAIEVEVVKIALEGRRLQMMYPKGWSEVTGYREALPQVLTDPEGLTQLEKFGRLDQMSDRLVNPIRAMVGLDRDPKFP